VGEELVENVKWGRGLAENVRIPSYGGRGLKLLKNRHMIFERSLNTDEMFFASLEFSSSLLLKYAI